MRIADVVDSPQGGGEDPRAVASLRLDRRELLGGLAAATLAGAAARPAKAAAEAGPAGFVAIGDWGRKGEGRQRKVAAAMGRAATEINSRFVLAAGDNFYPAGVDSVTDPHWQTSFENVYTAPGLQTPWYVCLGIHDYRGDPRAQIAYSRQSDRWRMPHRHYKVSGDDLGIAGLDLFVLDTSQLVDTPHEKAEQVLHGHFMVRKRAKQMAWLSNALAESQAPWKIVLAHHGVYSGSHGEEPILVNRVAPLMERYGVQAYINGHDHDLQHIRRGAVDYICTGAGSDVDAVEAVEGTQFYRSEPGFSLFVLEGDVMKLEFRDLHGETLYQARIPRTRA
jgi:tartrate-resistant acid phosphatase type 5